ncbi:MAG: hypothetical protein CL535_08495 [Ahrensia sp.]|nr:hypothetical protein [Ahrensia sp.]
MRIVLGSGEPEAAAQALADENGAEVRGVAASLARPDTTARLIGAALSLVRLDAALLDHGHPLVRLLLGIAAED